MRYLVITSGYDGGEEFSNLTKAREHLAKLVDQSLTDCKRRFGCATKVKNGEDNYTIKIGSRDSASNWVTHCILKF